MPPKKPIKRRGRKPAATTEVIKTHWVPDNWSRDKLITDREQRIWDLQDELEALRGKSEDLQMRKIDEAIETIYPYRGREGQLKVLRWLFFQREDIMLIAKTSFGKSMIMQVMPCLLRGSVVLVILPLNAIGAEQVARIEALPGTRPVHVCRETICARMIADIRRGIYTHILLSPELLVGKKFHGVLTTPTFRDHVGLVVIDEVHLVSNWGSSFRSAYSQLWKLRTLLGRKPWFACTATLDDITFKIVRELAGFQKDVHMVRTSIDRPELSIVREYIKKGEKNSFKALYFIIDQASDHVEEDPTPSQLLSAQRSIRYIPCPQRIPKTVIFLGSKESMAACRDTIRLWLKHRGYNEGQAKMTVQLYHASLALADKASLYAEFQKSDSTIRIMICSDALAHGCDIADIRRAIQFGMPRDKEPNMIWQRFGRAARGDKETGEAIFLMDDWCKGPREHVKGRGNRLSRLRNEYIPDQEVLCEDGAADFDSDIASMISLETIEGVDNPPTKEGRELSPGGTTVVLPADIQLSAKPNKRPKTHVERRAALPDCLYNFANEEKGCLRQIFLLNYKEQCMSVGTLGCCSNCDSSLRAYNEFDLRTEQSVGVKRPRRESMFTNIKGWLSNWLHRKYPDTVWIPSPGYIISDKQLDSLCHHSTFLTDERGLRECLPDWDCEQLGADLADFIKFVKEEDNKAAAEENMFPISLKSSGSSQRKLKSKNGGRTPVSSSQNPQLPSQSIAIRPPPPESAPLILPQKLPQTGTQTQSQTLPKKVESLTQNTQNSVHESRSLPKPAQSYQRALSQAHQIVKRRPLNEVSGNSDSQMRHSKRSRPKLDYHQPHSESIK